MNELTTLVKNCVKLGIRMNPNSAGDLTVDANPGVLTPEIIEAIRSHKTDLLSGLRAARQMEPTLSDPNEIWARALAIVASDPLFSSQMMRALREATVYWDSDNLSKNNTGQIDQ